MIKLICQSCNKEFEVWGYMKNIRKFCSKRCYGDSLIGKKGKMQVMKKIIIKPKMICGTCGQEFEINFPCRKKVRKFCSLECAYGNREVDIRHKNNRIKKNCLICNNEFLVKSSENHRKYCSKECSIILLRRSYEEKFGKERAMGIIEKLKSRKRFQQKKVLCECGCGQELDYLDKTGRPRRFIKGHVNIWNKGVTKEIDKRMERISETRKRLFKEGKLIPYDRRLEKNSNWNNGSSFEPYGKEFNDKLREFIRKRDNYACQECGKKVVLSVHHIDHCKQNNSTFNLISLCNKCHTKTNGNRKHWEAYFKMKMFIKEFFNPENIKVFENKRLIAMGRLR